MSSVGKIRRLLQILEYLQSGRRYHTGELSEFVGVSKRTIFRDLKVLQDSGVQLLYDDVEQGYWIPPSTYLPPTDLTVNETLSLLMIGEKLGNPRLGVPFHSAARDASLKLLANLPPPMRNLLSDLSDHMHISMEAHDICVGTEEHYRRALEAIEKRRKIRVSYDSLHEQKTITTLVSPYLVFFQKRSWYVIGRSSLHREVRTFHVGRILDSTLTDDPYEIPPRFSLQKHFGNAWRMVRGQPTSEVIVRFQPLVARNVAEVIWHTTQKLVWNPDGSLTFHATVDGIEEIVWWILGYGDQAEVLAPRSLRELIVAKIQNMTSLYRMPIESQNGHSTSPPQHRSARTRSVRNRSPRPGEPTE